MNLDYLVLSIKYMKYMKHYLDIVIKHKLYIN